MSREKGDASEKRLIDLLDAVGIKSTKTINSGAKYNDGDIFTSRVLFEVKFRATRNATINQDTFDKLKNQAIPNGRVPILVLENENGQMYAVLDLETFVRLYLPDREEQEEQEEDNGTQRNTDKQHTEETRNS